MMLKQFCLFGFLAVCLFAVCLFVIAMGGCGGDDDKPLLEEEEPIKFVSANPVSGSTIQNDATITVTFDGIPEGLEVTGGTVTLSDKTVTLSGPFAAGSLTLGLKWEGDAVVLSYTVEAPPPPDGMVLIPAGSFEMGSDAADADWAAQPVHTVHLDAFYMDVYEVTNAQFKAFVDANPAWGKDAIADRFNIGFYLDDWNGNDYPAGKAAHPVVEVTWYAAMAYAEWAGKRLPTEAEWEYAARGGLAGKTYPWGDREPTAADANYDKWEFGGPTPVGQYPANGYGLYDMAGNVWEWCLDAYDRCFYAGSAGSRNPISGGQSIEWLRGNFKDVPPVYPERMLRGGFWRSSATGLGVVNRHRFAPATPTAYFGFRCVKPVTP